MSGNQTPLKSPADSIYAASHVSGFSNGIPLEQVMSLINYLHHQSSTASEATAVEKCKARWRVGDLFRGIT
jgi:hypothetical protein